MSKGVHQLGKGVIQCELRPRCKYGSEILGILILIGYLVISEVASILLVFMPCVVLHVQLFKWVPRLVEVEQIDTSLKQAGHIFVYLKCHVLLPIDSPNCQEYLFQFGLNLLNLLVCSRFRPLTFVIKSVESKQVVLSIGKV